MSKILTAVILASLALSCAKKSYEQADQPKMQTVLALNSGDSNSVINNLEGRKDLDEQESYYLSSAYAMKGGLDVSSLFPLLEMYLFNQPAYKWTSLKDVKDPYKKFLSKANKEKKTIEEKTAEFEKYDELLRRKYGVDYIPACDGAEEYRDEAIEHIKSDLNKRYEKRALTEYIYTFYWKGIREKYSQDEVHNRCDQEMREYGESQWRYLYRKQKMLFGDDNSIAVANRDWQSLILELLWNTYEAIPFLQRVPDLNLENQNDISRSIELQMELKAHPEFKTKAFNNVVYLTTLSILSIYKKSFDVNKVDGIQDIFCQFDPEAIFDYYPVLVKRVKTLKTLLDESETKIKGINLKEELARLEETLNNSPDEISLEKRDEYAEILKNKKFEACVDNDNY